MNEDMDLQMMIDAGYLEHGAKGLWRLTPKGKAAFERLVESDPKFYAKEFPEWVKIEWIQ